MGMIYNIQRFSAHDGPGIRTTVFMKGCPLRCAWCHNPESQSVHRQLSLFSQRCIGCGRCFELCGVHRAADGTHAVDYAACKACGRCAEACPSAALEIIGREADAEEIVREALRDAPFYRVSGGGITLSGGEPTMQDAFALEILTRAKEHGLHTAMETCGYCDRGAFARLLPKLDLILYDIKQMNPEKHRAYTGVDPRPIFDNLRFLCGAEQTADVMVRAPVIPGYNDDADHYHEMTAFLRTLGRAPRVEMLPYNTLAGSKYPRLGMTYAPGGRAAPSPETLTALRKILTDGGIDASILA